jgi:hypothetical protein
MITFVRLYFDYRGFGCTRRGALRLAWRQMREIT